MAEYDLVIRGGTVVDGSGAPERTADVAIRGAVIVEVGRVSENGGREIDADGTLVTPGFVDVHTHYDAQVTWDNYLAPSSWHGVTTVVMGNCGVGFAPVRDNDHQRLIEIMEGVEDIPGTALHEGIPWGWNSFGEYLDATDAIPHDVDFGAYVPHDALRLFVMGDRGAGREPATDEDIEEMGRVARAAVEAGAFGFSTDRMAFHHTSKGDQTPAYGAAARECIGIAGEVGKAGSGVLQVVSDFEDLKGEFDMMDAMAQQSAMPLGFTLTYRYEDDNGRRLKALLDRVESANARGLSVVGQVAPRGIGLIYGLQLTLNPFSASPVYREIESLPAAERFRIMIGEGFRDRLLANTSEQPDFRIGGHRLTTWELMYEMTDPPNYEPDVHDSIANRAARSGCRPEEIAFDIMMSDGGTGMIYLPTVNYRDGNLDVVKTMIEHPFTIPGLSDGGAHVGAICDASFPTTLLAHWGRDRTRGLISIPYLVKQQTADAAQFVGLHDRGLIAPGYRADINVIDMERLSLRRPTVQADLPAGGSRLMQRANGYVHTIVRGVVTYDNGLATGSLPGRLVRGRQPPPAAPSV